MRAAWLVDVDGTLALRGDRNPYDWRSSRNDSPNSAVVTAVQALRLHQTLPAIIAISGREEKARLITAEWLELQGVPFDELLMRADGDMRSDEVIKKEIFDNAISPRYNVIGVFDDRNRVVKMWRSIGLVCFQVADGDF